MVGAQLPLKKLVERLFFTWKTKYQCLRGLTLLLEPLRAVNILACGSEISAACVCVLSTATCPAWWKISIQNISRTINHQIKGKTAFKKPNDFNKQFTEVKTWMNGQWNMEKCLFLIVIIRLKLIQVSKTFFMSVYIRLAKMKNLILNCFHIMGTRDIFSW